MSLDVDMIELDVQLSRDERLVVIHDDVLDRTTNGRGMVRSQDLAALKTLDAGSWFAPRFAGERLLTLDEVIDLVGIRVRLNVEIKAPQPDWLVLTGKLVTLLNERGLLRSTIVSCFEPGALVAMRQHTNDVRLGLLWQAMDGAAAWEWAKEVRAESIHPYWALATKDLLEAAHARGLQVVVWTVNDLAVMQSLAAAGVDGIISDHPERFGQLAM